MGMSLTTDYMSVSICHIRVLLGYIGEISHSYKLESPAEKEEAPTLWRAGFLRLQITQLM